MANALGLAATTRLLREIIEGNVTRYGLDGYVGENVLVTAEPPLDDSTRHRINVFLYRAAESPQVRNNNLPTHDNQGRPLQAPVLSLDLNYAITAYADSDYQSEYMLGCAMQALHEVPVIGRSLIREILTVDTPPNSVMDSRLFEQIQSIRVRHRNLTEESFSRLWSTFHVPYRLSAFYEVSVVFIESETPSRIPMPVLARPEPNVHGSLAPVTPTLIESRPVSGAPGEAISINGVALSGSNVEVEGIYRDSSIDAPSISIPQNDVTESSVSFQVPASWPIGICELRITQDAPSGTGRRVSNRIPFLVVPAITVSSTSRDPNPPNSVSIQLNVSPQIQPSQRVKLIIGTQVFPGDAVNTVTGALNFTGLDIAPGSYPIRLQVDGIGSTWLDRSTSPATILPSATVTIP